MSPFSSHTYISTLLKALSRTRGPLNIRVYLSWKAVVVKKIAFFVLL